MTSQPSPLSLLSRFCAYWPARTLTNAFESLVSIGTLLYGAHYVVTGDLTVGDMVAGSLLVAQFLNPVSELAEKGVDLQEARLSLDRVEDALNRSAEDEGGDYAGPVEGDIAFEAVRYRFSPTAPPVVDDLNLVLRQGETILRLNTVLTEAIPGSSFCPDW